MTRFDRPELASLAALGEEHGTESLFRYDGVDISPARLTEMLAEVWDCPLDPGRPYSLSGVIQDNEGSIWLELHEYVACDIARIE